jgi:hypothetical protein
MNTLWTIMAILPFDGPFAGNLTGLVYPSLEACAEAKFAVGATLGYDYRMLCVETNTPSASMRPVPRPEGLGE